jgi:branched-subunit amino acid transport protein AzlD
VQADSFNGIDHGIAVFIIRAAIQYHAMRVEPFMVFVKEPFPHRVGLLQAHAFVR